jgi:NAD-dependent deacetylase sirtuin 4
VTAASDAVAACDAVLVVGTSLSTFSSFRLVRDAAAAGREVLILNEGVTRADDRATTKVEGRCGPVLRECVRSLIR